MKQIVLPALFRRRNGHKKMTADIDAANDGADVGQGMIRESDARAAISSPPRRRTSAIGHRRRRLKHDVPAIVAPTRVIDLAEAQNDGAAETVSTLTNFGLEATMKTTESLLAVEKDDGDDDGSRMSHKSHDSFESAYSYEDGGGGIDDVGISHLSVRERMWYKNQIYLLDKQRRGLRRESSPTTPTTPPPAKGEDNVAQHRDGRTRPRPAAAAVAGRLSSRYESVNRGADRYSAGIDRHAIGGPNPNYSPKGVDEESTASESTNMYEGLNHCDSLMLPDKRTTRRVRSPISDDDDDDDAGTHRAGSTVESEDDTCCADTRTTQSRSLLNDGRTIRSSSLLGLSMIDDDDTHESSFLFPDDEEGGGGEGFLHDVSLESGSPSMGSVAMEIGALESGAMDENTLQETLDDTASVTPSYMFELVDDAGEQHGHRRHRRRCGKEYQLRVGRNAATHELRRGVVKTSTEPIRSRRSSSAAASESTTPTSRHSSARSRLSYNTSADDTDDFAADAMWSCPCFPDMVDEIAGTCADAASAFDQVQHAFFVSEDDVDAVVDRLRDARVELAEMYRDRFGKGQMGRCGGKGENSDRPEL